MAQKPSIPKGTRDFGQQETAERNYIFDTVKSAGFYKPYVYNMNVKAGDEIKINVEWQPHRRDK